MLNWRRRSGRRPSGRRLSVVSRPDLFRGRDVILFIDNVGALMGLANGYSRDVDAARLINVFHVMNAALQANIWFEFVPSAANLADQPSRGELGLLQELGSRPFDVEWPDPSSWSGGLDGLFNSFSQGGPPAVAPA